MDCLIFSDSHGKRGAMAEIAETQPTPPAYVFFLGDGLSDFESETFPCSRTYAVRGNCDWLAGGGTAATEECVTLGTHRAFLTHGHLFGAKSGIEGLLSAALERGCDIVLFGHTHEPYSECIPAGETVNGTVLTRPVYLFNPGSLREGSFGTLTVQGSNLLFSHGER